MQYCTSPLKYFVNTSFTHKCVIIIMIIITAKRIIKNWWTIFVLLQMWWIPYTPRNVTYIFKRNIFNSCSLRIRASSFVWLVLLCKSCSPSAQPAALLLWASGALNHANHTQGRLQKQAWDSSYFEEEMGFWQFLWPINVLFCF